MLKKALIASLICLGGLFSSSAAPTLGGPTLSAAGGSTNSNSGGVDTNAVIALIEQYGGGGGVVSNTVVQLTVDTWYTNGQYPVVVEAQIELPNSAALMLFSVKDTNSAVIGYLPGSAAWNEFGNASKYAFATTTATEDNVQSLGGYVPAYAAFRYYASGTTASIYDNAPNGTRLVYFGSGTNSGSGTIPDGSITTNKIDNTFYNWVAEGSVSPAQVAAIMATNNAAGATNLWIGAAYAGNTTVGYSNAITTISNPGGSRKAVAISGCPTNVYNTVWFFQSTDGTYDYLTNNIQGSQLVIEIANGYPGSFISNALGNYVFYNPDSTGTNWQYDDFSTDVPNMVSVWGTNLIASFHGSGSNVFGVNAVTAVQSYDLLYATNTPVRGRRGWDNWGQQPFMGASSYNVFPTSTLLGTYTNAGVEANNFMRWATNTVLFFSTNGMRAAGYDWITIDDGWQLRTNGVLTWNPAIFPMGWPAYCEFARSNGMKVMGYSAYTTNACNTNLVTSSIQYVYNDIQTMMAWGWDGYKADTCGDDYGTAKQNRDYLISWARLANQAREDYWAIVQSTNGICRPFYIVAPLTFQVMDPDEGVVTTEIMDMIDAAYLNWETPSVSLGANYIDSIRHMSKVAMKLSALLPPSKAIGMESFYGLTPGASYLPGNWTNCLSLYAAMASPISGRMAQWGYGTITNATSGGPNAEAPIYQLNDNGQYWTNKNFLDILRDPAGIRSTVVWSNQGVELWRRPMGGQDFSKDCVITLSAGTNSSLYHAATGATNITVTLNDFGGRHGFTYWALEPWHGSTTNFTTSLTVTLRTNSVQQFRIRRATEGYFTGNGAGLTNVAPRYFTYGFINTTINGTASHLHPSSGAGNTTFNVVAARVPVDTIISDINVRLTYVSHVDTNYFLLFTNGVYTGRSVEVSVSSAANSANSTTSTNVGNTFIPAGTLWALQVTNKSASSRQIYGDWAIRYFAQ